MYELLDEKMTEGRKTQITLLDDRRLDITIQPKLYAKELLDLVASHLNLKEKEYFGLYYLDEKGHTFWLQQEKKVLDHDFPRRSQLLLHLGIKFYVETIAQLRDKPAIELFYFNAKQAIYKGQIECDSETVFELAAHVLQITYGNFTTADAARDDLKKLCVVPTRTLQEHPSLGYCEERVLFHYQKLEGSTRGLAIVNYMTICESLPTYGIHYYEVKDKKDIPWWLGISHKGIAVYDKTDKQTPRKIFHWKQLENLYYRDKKFSVEVHDPKRVSVSRRTFGPGNVNVHAWFSSSPQLTKCIWLMAVAQHQFCLERRDNKTYLHPVRSMSEIAAELSHSSTSLSGSGASDLSRSTSSHSLPSLSTSRYDVNIDPEKVKKEMYQALKERQEALKEALRKKNEEFKQLCIQEGELIGHLPKDTPLAPGEQPPIIRRRVKTAFSLSSKLVPKDGEDMEDQLARLDLEYELQSKITSAAYKLAHDRSVSKQVRKQRKQVYHKAQTKLKDMEKTLNEMKKKAGHSTLKPCPVYEDPSEDSLGPTDSESEIVSPSPSPIPRPKKDYSQTGFTNNMEVIQDDPTYDPLVTEREERISPLPPGSPSHLSPSHSSPQLKGGYTPSSVYSTGTQYRNQRYPTFTNRTGPPPVGGEYLASSKFDGSHDSGFSSSNNMTQLPANQRSSQYENGDEVKTPTNHQYENLETEFEHQMKLNRQHTDDTYYSEENSTNVYTARGASISNNMQHLLQLTPSKYGSQRESEVEHTEVQDGLVTPCNSTVDAEPVYSHSSSNYEPLPVQWGEKQTTEPSPIIYSPHKSFEDLENRPNTPSTEHSYSPRVYEYQSPNNREVQVIHLTGNQLVSEQCQEMDQPPTSPIPPHSRIVTTITKIKPQIEVSKPFETSDFFKYSEKLRRARMLDSYQRQLIGDDRLVHLSKLAQQTDSSVNSYYSSSYTSEHSSSSSPVSSFSRIQQVTPSSPYMAYHHSQVQPQHHQSSSPQQQTQPQSTPSSPFSQYWREFEQHAGTTFPLQRGGTPGVLGSGSGMSSMSSRTVSSSYHHSISSSSSSSSHIQYSSAQSVSRVFRSHQVQTSRHTQYQPPQPMTCEPVAVRDIPSPGSNPGTGSPANLSNLSR